MKTPDITRGSVNVDAWLSRLKLVHGAGKLAGGPGTNVRSAPFVTGCCSELFNFSRLPSHGVSSGCNVTTLSMRFSDSRVCKILFF